MISKKKRASWPLTGLHIRKIFRANKSCQDFSDRKEKRLRRTPSAHHLEREGRNVRLMLQHNPAEFLVALQ